MGAVGSVLTAETHAPLIRRSARRRDCRRRGRDDAHHSTSPASNAASCSASMSPIEWSANSCVSRAPSGRAAFIRFSRLPSHWQSFLVSAASGPRHLPPHVGQGSRPGTADFPAALDHSDHSPEVFFFLTGIGHRFSFWARAKEPVSLCATGACRKIKPAPIPYLPGTGRGAIEDGGGVPLNPLIRPPNTLSPLRRQGPNRTLTPANSEPGRAVGWAPAFAGATDT